MAKLTESEYEKKILELASKGMTSERIGLELKKEKVYSKDFKRRIGEVLQENNIRNEPDLDHLKAAVQTLEKHAKVHKQDMTFKRSLSMKSAMLRKTRSD
jgi:ribosomal protein S15P/S13E